MKTPRNKLGTMAVVSAIVTLLCAVGGQADITVTRTTDSGSGSLRAALAAVADGDIISITATGAIKLTTGELVVTNSITIAGPSTGSLAINGNAASRVFHIFPNNTVTITGLIISNGMATSVFRAGAGGGIFNDASTLAVINCIISNNAADFGAGIYNDGEDHGGTELDIMNSTISGNIAGSGGGGIYNNGVHSGWAVLSIDSSTLGGNKARFGSGIYNDGESFGDAEAAIVNSTISGNQVSSGGGGGVFNNGANVGGYALLTIANSTFSGNKANFGGGIGNDAENSGDAEVVIGNSTLSGNKGGGIYNNAGTNGYATVDIGNTILNRCGANIRNVNVVGVITSHGFNLSSDNGGGFLTVAAGDLIKTNPKLGPLGDYGGPTKTHILLLGSPAIDQGNAGAIGVPDGDTDQRGEPRPFDFDAIPNAEGGDGSDIGAYEAQCLLPDLTGTWSTVAQTCSVNGHGQLSCHVKGKLTVQDIGIADAASSLVNYYLSNDATFDEGDTLLKQAATGSVHPGRPRNRSLSANLPPGVSGSGRFILAVIDADDTVTECNEDNNVVVFGPLP